MSLRELRRALGRTQVKVAKDLGIGQEAVSRLESRADMLISTLDRYIEEAGGKLELVARFPHPKPVKLEGLGDIETAARGALARGREALHAPRYRCPAPDHAQRRVPVLRICICRVCGFRRGRRRSGFC
jgi:transcriptional regulator with XRE-family HTH domain